MGGRAEIEDVTETAEGYQRELVMEGSGAASLRLTTAYYDIGQLYTLYTLYHASPKHQYELKAIAADLQGQVPAIGRI